jgi:hypothetical protein
MCCKLDEVKEVRPAIDVSRPPLLIEVNDFNDEEHRLSKLTHRHQNDFKVSILLNGNDLSKREWNEDKGKVKELLADEE